jgi:hypothetical protein
MSDSWPRSGEPPLDDLDLKRPGKIDPELRRRLEGGAPELCDGEVLGAKESRRRGRGRERTTGYDERGEPRRG